MSKIKVYWIPTEGDCRVIEIDNTLAALQKAVGGYIETVTVTDELVFIVNEEGLIHQLPLNRHLGSIFGNALLVGVDGDEFRSLTEREIRVARRFVG